MLVYIYSGYVFGIGIGTDAASHYLSWNIQQSRAESTPLVVLGVSMTARALDPSRCLGLRAHD